MELTCVKIRKSNQIYYADTNGIFIKEKNYCILETEHGIDIGEALESSAIPRENIEQKGKILRAATADDLIKIEEIFETEKQAFIECKQKSAEKKLDMKLVMVKCLFDKTKIIFFFVAENRIDFRDLVRDLASIFRTRIEMRQIGVRDESRLIGGYGTCGQTLCCTKFQGHFAPVSIKMAKEQNLNLNSLKISGICGRLLCCLGYEYEVYLDLNTALPPIGAEIKAEKQVYTVQAIDTLKQTIKIYYIDHLMEIHKKHLKQDGSNWTVAEEVLEKIAHPEEEDNKFDFKF